MKECIAIVNIPASPYMKKLFNTSVESITHYADRIGVPIVELTESKIRGDRLKFEFISAAVEKFQIASVLEEYDRVLSLDVDILINPNAPNIFDFYAPGNLYAREEGVNPDGEEDATFFEEKYGVTYPLIDGHKRVLNTGVVLWDKGALPVLQDFDLEDWTPSFDKGTWGGEQSYVNMKLCKHGIPVGLLDKKWNWLLFEKEDLEKRKEAFFVHYACAEFKELLLADSQTLWK